MDPGNAKMKLPHSFMKFLWLSKRGRKEFCEINNEDEQGNTSLNSGCRVWPLMTWRWCPVMPPTLLPHRNLILLGWERSFKISSWNCPLTFRAGFQAMSFHRGFPLFSDTSWRSTTSFHLLLWMDASERSRVMGKHRLSLRAPQSRSPQGCFLWNQAQSLARLSKQRCL